MNHNPHNFKEGNKAILDKEFAECVMFTEREVRIHSFTPNKLLALVSPTNDTGADAWWTMTNRLTPIDK